MIVDMLSFESRKGFQDMRNCLESLKTTRVWKSKRVWETTRSINNHKTMKILEDREVRKTARVKEGCQVSRNQNLKSMEDWQITRVKNQENNSEQYCSILSSIRRRKRERKERLQSQKHGEIQRRVQ
jgi:hypothetical protein